MKELKVCIIGTVIMIFLGSIIAIVSHCFLHKNDEPFTVVCKIGTKEESIPAIDYKIENGSCIITTDNGREIIVSDYAIFIDEPYYTE